MNKKSIHTLIVVKLEGDLEILLLAAKATYDRSTHAETKAENKYDTFGLEASYLAHGQSIRVQEVERALAVFRTLQLSEFDKNTPIGLSALVTLETEEGKVSRVWLAAEAGGVKVNYQDQEITIVTPQSPLGQQLVGKYQHDTFQLKINDNSLDYEIISIE